MGLLPGALAVLVYLWAVLAARRRRLPVLAPRALDRPLLVIVPARNEAARIGPTIAALTPSPHLRVVVYDDRSDEPLVLDGVTVVRGDEDPPPGVFGKPRALARAVEAAGDAERILFLDADVVLAPGALGALAAALDDYDAVSGLPRLVHGSVVEEALVPAFVVLVGSRGGPFLNGQVLAIRSSALAAVGGWRSVEDRVLEDVALAQRLVAFKTALFDLRGLASTRMYSSLAGILEGFGKNAVPAVGGRGRAILLAGVSIALAWAAPVSIVLAGEWLVAALAAWMVVTSCQAWLRRSLGCAAWPAFFSPLVAIFVAFVLLKAVLRRTVTWKGRTYSP